MVLYINAEEVVGVPAVGENSADNMFDSSLVTANEDGSALERLEYMNDTLGARDDAAAIPSATTSIVSIIKKIYNTVVNLLASILTLTETGGMITTDGTEQDVYVNNSPSGIFEPRIFQLDFTNQTAAETTVVRTYYRIKSGGAFIKQTETTYAGVQDPLLNTIDLEENRFGFKVTIEKTAGANRDYDYEVLYKV